MYPQLSSEGILSLSKEPSPAPFTDLWVSTGDKLRLGALADCDRIILVSSQMRLPFPERCRVLTVTGKRAIITDAD
jgi:hypothetical protein